MLKMHPMRTSIAALAFVAACGAPKNRNEVATDTTISASQSGNVPGAAAQPAPEPATPRESQPTTQTATRSAPRPASRRAGRPAATPGNPALTPTPMFPAPVSQPVSRMVRLDSGTALDLRAVNGLTSRRDSDGTRITATTAVDVRDRDGINVVIPAGAEFIGHVVRIRAAETPQAKGVMELAFDSVSFNGTTYPVATRQTSVATERVSRGVTASDAGKVGAGAVIGGVAGRVIGGNRTGTAVGAAAGAAAGGVYANQTRDIDLRLPSGAAIGIELTQPFTRTVVVTRQ